MKVKLSEAGAKRLRGEGGCGEAGLAGRREQHPSHTQGRFLGGEWFCKQPAGQRDHVQGRVGGITGGTGRRGCDQLIPTLGSSESRAELVNAFWEELPTPAPFVPYRGAAFSLAFRGLEEETQEGDVEHLVCAGAGVGTDGCPSPGPRSAGARGVCHLGGWGAQCRASSAPRFPGLFCSCGVGLLVFKQAGITQETATSTGPRGLVTWGHCA